MKKLARFLLVLGIAAVVIQLPPTDVQAQVVVTFDENGTGTIVGGPFGGTPITLSVVGSHPLTYILPVAFATPGDIVLYEDPAQTQFSDLVRFSNGNQITFYSDLETNEAIGDLADVSVIPTTTSTTKLTESGVEGGFQAVEWTPIPGSGGPGDSAGFGFTTSYVVVSDVPEPGTVTMLGLSVVGLLAIVRRRKA
jgi:hypothetical protein